MAQIAFEPAASSPDKKHANGFQRPGLIKVTWLQYQKQGLSESPMCQQCIL